jgi:hypothetical protein
MIEICLVTVNVDASESSVSSATILMACRNQSLTLPECREVINYHFPPGLCLLVTD